MNDRAGPRSATEIQAVVTLKAARDVAETIESLRTSLRAENLPRSRRERLKTDLLESAERLCNLLDLLLSWLAMVSSSIRDPLKEGIQELQGKLLATGMRLIGDRLDKLVKKAGGIVDGSEGFPLGISMRLSETLWTLTSTVDALGGTSAMPEEVAAKLDEAESLIGRLKEMEEELGLANEFDEN